MAKRSERLKAVVDFNQKEEEKAAEALAIASNEVKVQENRLIEFEAYRGEYGQQFSDIGSKGMDAKRLREYQAFIAKINNILEQQRAAIQSVRQEYEVKKRQWLAARNKLRALNKVQNRHQLNEKILENRNEQKELDEHVIRRHRSNNR